MQNQIYNINTTLWLYSGDAAWHFITIPKDISEEISFLYNNYKKGWGSLPVKVKIGSISWETSIFPDKKSGSYLLPVKASVRKSENLNAGDEVNIELQMKV